MHIKCAYFTWPVFNTSEKKIIRRGKAVLGSKVSVKASTSLDGSKNYVLELPRLGVNVKRVPFISRDIL